MDTKNAVSKNPSKILREEAETFQRNVGFFKKKFFKKIDSRKDVPMVT